jgi:RHS repeat-associated protein
VDAPCGSVRGYVYPYTTCSPVQPPGWTGTIGSPPTCSGAGQRVCPSASPAYTLDPGGLTCSRERTPKQLGVATARQMGTFLGCPIDCGNGNKFLREVDYAGTGVSPLRFERFYNSASVSDERALGRNWRHTYMRTIVPTEPTDGRVEVRREDGKVLVFIPNAALTSWVPEADIADRLTRLVDAGNQFIGWEYRVAASDEIERYDTLGRLTRITTRSGLETTLAYSDATPLARLTTVTDPAGRQLVFAYNAGRQLVSVTHPAGAVILYRYGVQGAAASMVSEVEYPGAQVRKYRYGNQSGESTNAPSLWWQLLTGVIDERGIRMSTYRYDAANRAISTELAGSVNRYQVAYPADPTQRTVTDPLGVVRTYTFAMSVNLPVLTGITGPVCPNCGPASRTYDASGNISSTTDWNGFRTNYTFDLSRNLETSRTEGLNGNGSVRPESRTIDTQWHATWRLPIKVTERNNAGVALRETEFAYDARGNLASRTLRDVASGQTRTTTWTHTYSATIPGLITQTVEDGPRTDVPDTITRSFDPATGNLLSVTRQVNSAIALTTTFGNYDAHGNARTITDENGVATTLAFDGRQRLTSVSTAGESTGYTYNAAGLLTRVTQPDGSRIDYTYDDAQRLIRIEDGLGNRIEYALDAMGNRTAEQVRDAGGTLRQARTRVYSTLNRLAQEVGAAGQTTAFSYDNQGNVTSIDGPLAGVADTTTRLYDALNRLTRTTAPDTGQVNVTYNALNQTTLVTDPRAFPTTYTINGLGNETQEVSRDRGTTTRTFDAAGNVATETDAAGRTATYTRDALGRVTQSLHTQAGQPTLTQSFVWDLGANSQGRLTSVIDASGSTAWQYDARGRVVAKTQAAAGLTHTVQYHHDLAGRLDRIVYPSGRTVAMVYDTQGRVGAMTLNGANLIEAVTYHPYGPPTQWRLSQAAALPQVNRPIDQDGRISGFSLGAQTRTVTFDAASRIVQIATSGQPAQTVTASYDTTDRLTGFTTTSTTRGYGYDLNGNRTSRTTGGSATPYTYATDSNRLLTVGTSPTRTYEAGGRTLFDGARTLAHDARGRLRQVSAAGSTVVSEYNALGERVVKRSNPGTAGEQVTTFVYDEGGRLLGEYGAGGAPIQETVWLGDIPVATLRGAAGATEVLYVHADQIGAPRLLTDTLNRERWRWDLAEPFGDDPVNESPAGLAAVSYHLRFPGQYLDRETGLHYNYFRDYDPAIGRYVQADPIGLAGGVNLYGYAEGNPLSYADPDGRLALNTAAAGIGAAIGAGINIAETLSNPCWTWRDLAFNAGVGAVTGGIAGLTFGRGVPKLPKVAEGVIVGAAAGAFNAAATGLGDPMEDAAFGAIAGAFGAGLGRAAGQATYWRQFPYGPNAKREAQRVGVATGVVTSAGVGGTYAGVLDFAYSSKKPAQSADCGCR